MIKISIDELFTIYLKINFHLYMCLLAILVTLLVFDMGEVYSYVPF